MVKVGDKIQVEIREIDDRGKLSLVPVEVVEREAAARNCSGGERPGLRPEGGRRPGGAERAVATATGPAPRAPDSNNS